MDEIYKVLHIHPERLTLTPSTDINVNHVYIITPTPSCTITNHLNEVSEHTERVIVDKIIKVEGSYELVAYSDIMTYLQKMYKKDIQFMIDNPVPNDGIILTEPFEFISESLCNELIDHINTAPSTEVEHWKPENNVNCKFIKLNEQSHPHFDQQLYKVINQFIQHLSYKYRVNSKGDSGYCLRKIYGPTRLHSDGVLGESEHSLVSVLKIRNVSVIIALNGDYDDGEFYFPSQHKVIKLKKGQLIAFPPYWTHPHTVFAPTNGTYRYTINTWLYQ